MGVQEGKKRQMTIVSLLFASAFPFSGEKSPGSRDGGNRINRWEALCGATLRIERLSPKRRLGACGVWELITNHFLPTNVNDLI